MRRYIALIAWLAVAACSSSSVAATPSPSPSPSANHPPVAAQIVSGGCGGTHVYKGGEPDWLTAAGAGNNPTFLPYAIGYPPTAAGFIFGYPLQVGPRASGAANKILWVVGIPRDGNPLRITGHPQNGSEPTINVSFPADSGPGEIYPSIVDVPSAGCWHFDLGWGSNRTSIDLVYG